VENEDNHPKTLKEIIQTPDNLTIGSNYDPL
jgi:hypothetical protein